MTNKTIFYHVSGRPHLPYLVVSLHTLRQYWDGEIRVYAWPESIETVRQIGIDKTLDIWPIADPCIEGRTKGSYYLPKIRIAQKLHDCNVALYLDCDTSIAGPLNGLFDAAEKKGFACTQFNKWKSTQRVIQNRLGRLRKFDAIPGDALDELAKEGWPSLNCGIWATQPNSKILPVWYDYTALSRGIFIPDEMCLHILMVTMPNDMQVISGRYNTSPKYQSFPDDEIKVWHYHGDLAVRMKANGIKSFEGYQRWFQLFEEVCQRNIGGINEWLPTCGNASLFELMRMRKNNIPIA